MSPAVPDADDFRRLREEIVAEVRELRQALDAGFMRKDVAAAETASTNLMLKGFEDELHVVSKRLDGMDDRQQRATFARWSIGFSALIGPILVVVLLHAMGLIATAHK